jgi:hypothetical protein
VKGAGLENACEAEEGDRAIPVFSEVVAEIGTHILAVTKATNDANTLVQNLKTSVNCGHDTDATEDGLWSLAVEDAQLADAQRRLSEIFLRIVKASKVAALKNALTPQDTQLVAIEQIGQRSIVRVRPPAAPLVFGAKWLEQPFSANAIGISLEVKKPDLSATPGSSKICQRDPIAELDALAIDNSSVPGLFRERCHALPTGETQTFFCARILEFARGCLLPEPTHTGACSTLADLDKQCASSPNLGSDAIANVSAQEIQRQFCGAAVAFRDSALHGKLVQGVALSPSEAFNAGWLPIWLKSETDLAANIQVRSKCNAWIAAPGAGEQVACSARTAVRALGDESGLPNCGIPPTTDPSWIELVVAVAGFGAGMLSDGGLWFGAELAGIALTDVYNRNSSSGRGYAGCRDVCVVLPPRANVQRIQGYGAWEINGQMLPQKEGVPNDNFAKTLWEKGEIRDENDFQTVVCKRFRNWWKDELRDAQLVIYYFP